LSILCYVNGLHPSPGLEKLGFQNLNSYGCTKIDAVCLYQMLNKTKSTFFVKLFVVVSYFKMVHEVGTLGVVLNLLK